MSHSPKVIRVGALILYAIPMDEDNSSMTASRELGIHEPATNYPSPPLPESAFSVRNVFGLQSAVNAYAGSKIWNIGYTKPPDQNIRQFSGDSVMKTYLSYFATGDLHAYLHGRRIR